MKRTWVIDVCKTCGRIATWPFCEHRPEGWVPIDTPPWCESVAVREIREKKEADG